MNASSGITDAQHIRVGGFRLHIFQENGDKWSVWLNTEISDFDGLCLAIGPRRETAIQEARHTLRDMEGKLGLWQ